jgi:hypothetical protein
MLFSELTLLVENLLSSSLGNTNASELIYDGLIAGHTAILPWVPNYKETIISGSDGRKFVLPDDVFSIEGVYDPSTTVIYAQVALSAGNTWGLSTSNDIYWYPIPTGYISLNRVLTSGYDLGIIYRGMWGVPADITDIDFVVTVPKYAIFGVALFATSYVIGVLSGDTSALRQYNTRIDSGSPSDNPVQNTSEFFMKRFVNEMGRMPALQRIMEYK